MKPGAACSFYHEGGSGERHWVIGWRYGIILEVPRKGQHLNWVRVEVPVDLFGWDAVKKRWEPKPRVRAWVPLGVVNEPGDFIYHGPKLTEVVKERKSAKALQQAKADKRKRKPA